MRLAERLVHRAADPQHDKRGDAADEEADPPTPFVHRVVVEEVQRDEQGELGQYVAADEGDVLERRKEAAPIRRRRLGHVRRRRTVLAAGGEPLHEPGEDQDHRRPIADALARGHDGHDERACRHDGDAEHQRRLAATPVREATEEPRSHRSHEERHREDRVDVDRRVGVGLVEELRLEIGREHRVDVDVVPLDEVAR